MDTKRPRSTIKEISNTLKREFHNEGSENGSSGENPNETEPLERVMEETLKIGTSEDRSNDGYTAEESSSETEETAPPLQQNKVNLLEKTRIWKHRQLKSLQYETLMNYFGKMTGYSEFNWYRRFGGDLWYRPECLEDFPCECYLEEGCQISGSIENVWEGEPATTQESTYEILTQHNIACKIGKLSLYFSYIANYFIGEHIHPDLFLYIPLPREKYLNKAVDYNYYILQETRLLTSLKLEQRLGLKMETYVPGMNTKEKRNYKLRNQRRVEANNVLCNFLEYLVKPYKGRVIGSYHEDDDSSQKPRTHTNNEDKRWYKLLKAERKNWFENLENEFFERNQSKVIEDAIKGQYYIPYESFVELSPDQNLYTIYVNLMISKFTDDGQSIGNNDDETEEDSDYEIEGKNHFAYLKYLNFLKFVKTKGEELLSKKRNLSKETEEPERRNLRN